MHEVDVDSIIKLTFELEVFLQGAVAKVVEPKPIDIVVFKVKSLHILIKVVEIPKLCISAI